jgi:DNA invertase Pin-like site-specific DNA recombinase
VISTLPLVPAAQYLRMSTDHQQYSLRSQATAIQRYAERHGFTLIRTYEDAGKSGLSLKRRNGLASLLRDVVSRGQPYKAILVYDVSRWGRFQDTDEAAHYEFVCKSAGVPVHYCAETFTNDGTLPNTIMKALKRAMAGEYSRELSVKISRAKRLATELGFRAGGSAGYGFRRMLLSADGTHKRLLETGEYINNGKVILVHGPANQVARVREIYRLTIEEKRGAKSIARELNRRHVKHPGKPAWSYEHIVEILTNPKYMGAAVLGRTTSLLGTEVVAAPPDKWTVKAGAFEPIVDPETFAAAQRVLRDRTLYRSDEELLDRLRSLLSREGELSIRTVDGSRDVPAARTYKDRFGSMKRAYDLIGYVYQEDPIMAPRMRKIMWNTRQRHERLRKRLLASIRKCFPGELKVVRKGSIGRPLLCFRNGLRVSALVCPFFKTPLGNLRWNVPRLSADQSDVTLLCRCNLTGDAFHDLYLVPSVETPRVVRIKEDDHWLKCGKRLTDLTKLRRVAGKLLRAPSVP